MKNTLDSSIVKLTNYRSVWGYIHKNKQATIPQIAKSIGLSLPTVTRAIDYGIAEGIINPDGVIGAERGRKAQVYKLNADYMHFLLIYLDSDVLSYRIHDFRSRTIGSGNIPICDEKVLSTLENLVMTSVAADPLIAMTAIAVSGVVCKGVVMDSAAFPSLNHIDVAKRLNEKFGLTVLIDNDLHVATNVARKYSNYQDGITVLYAYGKRKSGSGIIANGEVLCGTFDVEDLAMGTIRFDNGAQLQIEFSWASNVKKETRFVELRGTKAGLNWQDGEVEFYTEEYGKCLDVIPTNYATDREHARNLRHFYDVVIEGAEPCFKPQQGIDMIKILCAVYESARTGREVVL